MEAEAATVKERLMPSDVTRDEVLQLGTTGAQLVEVLPAEEFEWAHLPQAMNVPMKQLDADCEQLDRSRPVIVYCNDTL